MLSGVGTDVVRSWNGCCPEMGRMSFGCPELERMLSGVGTDVVRSLAVCWQKSHLVLIGVSPYLDLSFAVCWRKFRSMLIAGHCSPK